MEWQFSGSVIEWRGPAPFLFIPLPADAAEMVRSVAGQASYGWGCIPVVAEIGETRFSTSLFPRQGAYLLPVKVAVQRAEGVALGDEVRVWLQIAFPDLPQ